MWLEPWDLTGDPVRDYFVASAKDVPTGRARPAAPVADCAIVLASGDADLVRVALEARVDEYGRDRDVSNIRHAEIVGLVLRALLLAIARGGSDVSLFVAAPRFYHLRAALEKPLPDVVRKLDAAQALARGAAA